jgi:hypothetical protein
VFAEEIKDDLSPLDIKTIACFLIVKQEHKGEKDE